MAYIRSNEDWYRSQGRSAHEARVQVELDRRGVDSGYCNPIKIKHAAEVEREVRYELREQGES